MGRAKSSKRNGREKDNSFSAASGCMCAVFQLFDFHHFNFSTLHQHQQQPSIVQTNSNLLLHEDPPLPKGAEAPRNSLELEESEETSSFMSSSREDESLNIPMGIQIKTSTGDNTTRSKAHGRATTYAPSDCSSEISSSPGTKTPNLVARLMGLDLLPENNNISSSSTSTLNTPNLQHGKSYLHHFKLKNHLQQSNKPIPHRNSVDGSFTVARSLPETPRISLARRSDVDLHHRLSLQINKENTSPAEELVLSRISSLRRLKEVRSSEDNESRSPSHYARQIVKQVKESVVGRKVGKDITNTVRSRAENVSKEELVSRFKSKNLSKMGLTNNVVANVEDLSSPGKQSTSCSPRLKFLEIKNKENYNYNNISNVVSHPPKASLSTSSYGNNVAQIDKWGSKKPNLPPLQVQRQQQQQQDQQRPVKNCKKVKEEKFGTVTQPKLKKPPQTSDIIRNKQEEPFVIRPTLTSNIPDKKCKKTPLSNHLLNISSVPTLLPVKKDPTPPVTKIPLKQVPSIAQESKRGCSHLSSISSQSYNQEPPSVLDTRGFFSNNDNNKEEEGELNGGCCSIGDVANEEYEYVTRILRRTGIDNDTDVSFARWFSPSHPLDPSTFHHLENLISLSKRHCVSVQLSHKCNRKLMFHLVDEILVEILKPYINLKPWCRQQVFGHGEMLKGSHLVSRLCTKIKSYPRADCHVLEDIDGIIDKDLGQMKIYSELAFEEEADWIVTEIEKDILDTLVHETVPTL